MSTGSPCRPIVPFGSQLMFMDSTLQWQEQRDDHVQTQIKYTHVIFNSYSIWLYVIFKRRGYWCNNYCSWQYNLVYSSILSFYKTSVVKTMVQSYFYRRRLKRTIVFNFLGKISEWVSLFMPNDFVFWAWVQFFNRFVSFLVTSTWTVYRAIDFKQFWCFLFIRVGNFNFRNGRSNEVINSKYINKVYIDDIKQDLAICCL